MQRHSIYFGLLTATLVSLSIGSCPAASIAHSKASPVVGLKPTAWFGFSNKKELGEDAISHGRKSVIVGDVSQVDSPFGCAAEFDGKGRISVNSDNLLNFDHAFSATAWVDGSGGQYRTLNLMPGMRSPNFQVVGDKIYFMTNSDQPADDSYKPPKKGQVYRWPSILWSGFADVNLGTWHDEQRSKLPMSGLEPKLQVVGNRMFFQYFGNAADGTWQIYTGTSGIDGTGWQSIQRTSTKGQYDVEQTRNIQVVGNKVYYAFPMKNKNGKWQLWTATSNLDGSSWRAIHETKDGGYGGLIPDFQVSGGKIYYIFVSSASKDEAIKGGYKSKMDVVIASSNLDGSGWHEIRRIHDATWWIVAELTVDKGTVYFSLSKGDPKGDAHLWTGSVATDGSAFKEHQRTFGTGNAAPAGIQVVGDKVLYSFSATKQPSKSLLKPLEPMGMSFWTASADLNGDHWTRRRMIGGDGDDYLTGYKMLDVVGGKAYYDVMRLHYVKNKDHVVRYDTGILAYSGSNILNKGDSYGIGMSASGSASGFVNAGEDYLYRGEAPEDTAGALVEQNVVPGWHHVAVTYDGSTLRLYVDGKLARETHYDKKPAANPFPLSIGDGFVGKIARLKLFDRELDQSEISALADRHNQTPCNPTRH